MFFEIRFDEAGTLSKVGAAPLAPGGWIKESCGLATDTWSALQRPLEKGDRALVNEIPLANLMAFLDVYGGWAARPVQLSVDWERTRE